MSYPVEDVPQHPTAPTYPVDQPDRFETAQSDHLPDKFNVSEGTALNIDDNDTSNSSLFVVDAITNAVYAGNIHESLQETYDSKDKRLVPSVRTAHINGVQPVLARFATRKNDETNMDETTWYPVTDGNLLALTGAIPGEWKMVHILNESEV